MKKLKLLLPLFILLIFTVVYSQQEQILSLRKFSGLNTKLSPHNIGDSQLQICENVFLDEDIGVVVRGGYEKFNTSPLSNYAWTVTTVDSDNAGGHNSLVLDNNEYPRISYQGKVSSGYCDLKFAKYNGISWLTSTLRSGGNPYDYGNYNSLQLDSNEYGIIASQLLVATVVEIFEYDYEFTLDNWTTKSEGTEWNHYTSLCIDSNDISHIVFYSDNTTSLRYALFSSPNDSVFSTIESDGDVGQYTAIDSDSNNYLHISYYDVTNTALKYANYTTSWSTSTIENSADVGKYTSIAIDSNDLPHISYWDKTNKNIKYAFYNGVSWTTSTVVSAGTYDYSDTSIAITSDDLPRIAYYEVNVATAVKYASYDGSSWSTTTVHSGTKVNHISLKLNSKDLPCISFYDNTNDDLKYAEYEEVACEPIRFLDEYTQSDGDKFLMMVYGSTVCYSVHKDSFTVLLGTMSSTADYWGEAYNDNYYIGNQTDGYYKFDGATFSNVSTSIKSLCSLCTYDKIYLGNQSGEKSKVIYSDIGDAETFTADQYLYINRNDGDEVTGIGMLSYPIVFKGHSMWRLINTDDAYPENDGFICISPSIGALYGSTIQEKDGLLYFMSERGIEVTDGVSVKKISDVIDGTMEDIVQRKATKGFWKQTTKEHFEQGTYGATTLDLETLSDSMYIKPQTMGDDFNQGTSVDVDTTTVLGDIVLSLNTTWSLVDAYLGKEMDLSVVKRSLPFTISKSIQGIRISPKLKRVAGTSSRTLTITLHESSVLNPAIATWTKSSADISTTATWYTFDNETLTLNSDYTYWAIFDLGGGSPGTADSVWLTSGGMFGYLMKIYQHPYRTTGNFTSQYLNFGSTPTSSGYFVTEETKLTGTYITYQVANSTANDGGWSGWGTIADGTDIDTVLATPKQYLKWKATLTTTENFETPTLSAVWQGSCFQSLEKNAGSDWTSWGLFESVGDFPSGTDMSYQIRTSSFSGGTTSASWQTIANLYEIENSTGPYIQFRVNLLRALETQSPRIDSLTVNWYDSERGLRPVSAVVDDRIWWAVKKKEDDYNQTVIVLDENGNWSEFTNFPAASFTFYKYNLYFGSSNDKGYVYRYGDNLTFDDTDSICPKVKTKSFDMKASFSDKEGKSLWVYNNYTTQYSSMTVNVYYNEEVSPSNTVQIYLGNDYGPKRTKVNQKIGERYRYIAFEFENFSKLFGLDYLFSILPMGEK